MTAQPALLRTHARRAMLLAREMAVFFLIALFGLTLDFCVFYALTSQALLPTAPANFISGWVGVTAVYALSSRFLYRKRYTVRMYVLFLVYYCISIGAFSALIAYLHMHTPLSALHAKAVTLPLSFFCNFLFNKLCLGSSARDR
jgi:putative flippase GtrA